MRHIRDRHVLGRLELGGGLHRMSRKEWENGIHWQALMFDLFFFFFEFYLFYFYFFGLLLMFKTKEIFMGCIYHSLTSPYGMTVFFLLVFVLFSCWINPRMEGTLIHCNVFYLYTHSGKTFEG
ncbi:hypothetical protein QBC38DRAFT_19788 [Podospora fimiseda]|uniref:Uncharacterized protein n=1 Tax=Podospora fimiseda TaxID=252190 RepID=A0AAN7BW34_9PEZI|nr:hypothetical protein QBC38DRAFT_19788 [Podospora fimiseda]